MNIVIQGTGMRVNEALEEWVHKKLSSLEKFFKNSQRIDVELEKLKGQDWLFRAEAQFMLGGKMFRAESRGEDMREAITDVSAQLNRKLRKFKGKQERQQRGGGREAKKRRDR